MKIRKCINGHYYDTEKFGNCPYCGGQPEIEIFRFGRTAFYGNNIQIRILASPDDENSVILEVAGPKFSEIRHFTMTVVELKKISAFFHTILNWKEYYHCEDDIDDGETWHIEYHYPGFDFTSGGYESYPHNFEEKMIELSKIINGLLKKYDPDAFAKFRIHEEIKRSIQKTEKRKKRWFL